MNRGILSVSLGVLSLAVLGCGHPSSPKKDAEQKHILNVVQLARAYSDANKKAPQSIDELKTWAIKQEKATDDDFISTRDGQPYILVKAMGGFEIYEQTGKNGKCYIFMMGGVFERDRELLPESVKKMSTVGPRKQGTKMEPAKKKNSSN